MRNQPADRPTGIPVDSVTVATAVLLNRYGNLKKITKKYSIHPIEDVAVA
jgi:hypothetical protein